jgi:hypothetical protein
MRGHALFSSDRWIQHMQLWFASSRVRLHSRLVSVLVSPTSSFSIQLRQHGSNMWGICDFRIRGGFSRIGLMRAASPKWHYNTLAITHRFLLNTNHASRCSLSTFGECQNRSSHTPLLPARESTHHGRTSQRLGSVPPSVAGIAQGTAATGNGRPYRRPSGNADVVIFRSTAATDVDGWHADGVVLVGVGAVRTVRLEPSLVQLWPEATGV